MKPLTDEQISYLLATPLVLRPLGSRVPVVEAREGVMISVAPVKENDIPCPPEMEVVFPGPPLCSQVTLPYHRSHMASQLSLFRFRWMDKGDPDRDIMPWDWDHTAWVPVHLFEIAVRTLVKRAFPTYQLEDADIKEAVYAFGRGGDGPESKAWVMGDRHLGAGTVSIDSGPYILFRWTYQGREVKFEVPTFLILNTVRGCVKPF